MAVNRVFTKTDAAYLELREQILNGVLPAGAVLDQGALADEMGVSTTPVREAIRRLESEHLVITKAHHDSRVAPLQVDELRDLYAIRLSLDPLAAELAATAATDEDIERAVRAIEAEGRTPAERLESNDAFHRGIFHACGNPILVQILDSLWDRSHRYRMLVLQLREEAEQADHEHRDIAAALVDRDGPRMYQLVKAHLEHSFEQIERLATQAIDEDRAREPRSA